MSTFDEVDAECKHVEQRHIIVEREITILEGNVAHSIDFRVRNRGKQRLKLLRAELKELRAKRTQLRRTRAGMARAKAPSTEIT